MAAKFEPDEKLVRKLSELLEETGLTEIEYEANGQRIRVARGTSAPATHTPAQAPNRASAGEAPAPQPAGPEAVPENALLSPMVGTTYVASEPGGAPFVKVGDSVDEGQTVLVIEAMKVMNPIPSPRVGKVTRIYVQDGQPVEYGEPLMLIE